MNSPEKIIDELGYYSAVVRGKSMLPLLHGGRDSVYIEKCDGFKKLDVALFRREDGRLVLHRIVGLDGESIIFAGDNDFVREAVLKNQLIGKMTEFCRNGKNISVDRFWYKLYSRVWCFSFPTKRLLKLALSGCKRVKSFICSGETDGE